MRASRGIRAPVAAAAVASVGARSRTVPPAHAAQHDADDLRARERAAIVLWLRAELQDTP